MQRIAVSAARDRHRVRTYGRYIHMRTYTHLHVNPTDYIKLYIDIFAYIYSIFSDAQPYIHTWTPAQASAYTCVRAHRRCRRAASKIGRVRPPRWRAAGRKAAHTAVKSLTRAMFHAPMSALNALAVANACEPSRTRSTPTERARTFAVRIRVPPNAHARTGARTDVRRGRVCGARTHRRCVLP